MMKSRGIAYKRAYRSAVKKAQETLYQKIGGLYKIFHGEWFNYEVFMASNPLEILWERFMKCARKLTKDKNLSVDDEMKEKICSDFARYPNELVKCMEEYNLFFHKLVYHSVRKKIRSNSDPRIQFGSDPVRITDFMIRNPIRKKKSDPIRLDRIRI